MDFFGSFSIKYDIFSKFSTLVMKKVVLQVWQSKETRTGERSGRKRTRKIRKRKKKKKKEIKKREKIEKKKERKKN
jgi:hypothetical protein